MMNISFGNTLNKRTIGYLTYTSSWRVSDYDEAIALEQETSGMSTMVVYDSEKYHIMSSLQFGIPYTYLVLSLTRKFHKPISKLRGVLK